MENFTFQKLEEDLTEFEGDYENISDEFKEKIKEYSSTDEEKIETDNSWTEKDKDYGAIWGKKIFDHFNIKISLGTSGGTSYSKTFGDSSANKEGKDTVGENWKKDFAVETKGKNEHFNYYGYIRIHIEGKEVLSDKLIPFLKNSLVEELDRPTPEKFDHARSIIAQGDHIKGIGGSENELRNDIEEEDFNEKTTQIGFLYGLDLSQEEKKNESVLDYLEDICSDTLGNLTSLAETLEHLYNKEYILPSRNISKITKGLESKPFLIFPGISGTGKTQIAREAAHQIVSERGVKYSDDEEEGWGWIQKTEKEQDRDQVAFLPVRPNWNEASQIWGNFNPLTGTFQATDALRVLLDAYRSYANGEYEEDDYPSHFIILDEMNLARVEYYFSDVLSLMESELERGDDSDEEHIYKNEDGEKAEIHQLGGIIALSDTEEDNISRDKNGSQGVPVARLEDEQEHRDVFSYLLGEDQSGRSKPDDFDLQGVPSHIAWPPNLGIIGTVNVDETTHSFAPKVLDRAHVVEFNDVNYEQFLNKFEEEIPDKERFENHLQILETILRPANLHFGYRTVEEMIDYADENPVSDNDTWDQLVSSKVLPKIHGRQDRISNLLKALYFYTKDKNRYFDNDGESDQDNGDEDSNEQHEDNEKETFDSEYAWSDIKQEIGDESIDRDRNPDFDNDFDLSQSGRKVFEMYNRMTDTGHASFF